MKRWLLLVVLGATLSTVSMLVLGAAGVLYLQGARGVCAAEDSVSCVWFGPVQGNGGGRIVVNGPDGPGGR